MPTGRDIPELAANVAVDALKPVPLSEHSTTPAEAVAELSPFPSRDHEVHSDLRSRQGLPHDAAVIVAGRTTVPLLRAPADAWGLQIIAADTTNSGRLVLFAALPLELQPDPLAHEGDVVVRLHADPHTHADSRAVVDVEVLLAHKGTWARVGIWMGVDVHWPHQIYPTMIRLMECDSRP